MASKQDIEAGSTKKAIRSSRPVPDQHGQLEAEEVEFIPAQTHHKPRMKWIYNSDHTDPVNFGFMFLVPDNDPENENENENPILSAASTVPDASSKRPSTAFVAPPNIPSGSSQPSPSTSSFAHHLSAIPDDDFDDEDSYLSALSSKTTNTPLNARQLYSQASSNQFQAPYQDGSPNPPAQQYSEASHHQLVYRPSPPLAPQTLPRQNMTSREQLAWQIQSQQEHIPSRWHQIKNDGMSAFEPFIDPASSTPTPVLIHQPSLTGKRKYSTRSPSPADSMLLSGTSRPSKPLSKKRRPHEMDPQSSFVARKPLICSRCHIYQVAHFTPKQTEDLLNRPHQSRNPGICNLCLQEFSMYTWPSANQTRMENLESLVLFLLPAHMEDSLLSGPSTIPRNRSWRYFMIETPHLEYDFDALTYRDQWATTVSQARSTGLWGDDYSAIADVARKYQLSLPRPNVSLDAAAACLIAVCDLYNCFVSAPARPATCSVLEIIANVRNVRITLRNAFQQLEHLALSPSQNRERKEWFPSFLSAVILALAAITYIDILGSCPSPYKEQIWGLDWGDRVREMRHGGYGMLIGVLKANTNGINPLKLDCWNEEKQSSPFIISTPKSYSEGKKSPDAEPKGKSPTDKKGIRGQWGIGSAAERERIVLLGRQSPQALAGILNLKKWETRYQKDLKIGEDMYAKELYAQAMMRPVASLWKVFEMKDTS